MASVEMSDPKKVTRTVILFEWSSVTLPSPDNVAEIDWVRRSSRSQGLEGEAGVLDGDHDHRAHDVCPGEDDDDEDEDDDDNDHNDPGPSWGNIRDCHRSDDTL